MVQKRQQGGVEETNRRLARVEDTLTTASKVFELMHARLEHLDSGQQALVDGQQRVIERLDMLADATVRDRTRWVDRFGRMERRIERLEKRLDAPRSRR